MTTKSRKRLPEVEREKVVVLSQKTLFSDEGADALSYLKNTRGFSEDTINDFGLGYVPKRIKNVYGSPHEFAGKIVIPIRDQYGELVSLSSRNWTSKDPKYKFWHEQYIKSNYLFGLDVAKYSIIKNNKAIVVEGEFDVMQLHTHNIKISVGMVGSALCMKQIAILSRYCNEIFFVFDGDPAGKMALSKVMKLSRNYKLDSLYEISMVPVFLPDDTDPDDFIKDNGKLKFIDLLKSAKNRYLEPLEKL